MHNEEGNANDEGIHPFWCFLSGTAGVNCLFVNALLNDTTGDNTSSEVGTINK
jgi:hypothetical protein